MSLSELISIKLGPKWKISDEILQLLVDSESFTSGTREKILSNALYSASRDGKYFAIAYKARYLILNRPMSYTSVDEVLQMKLVSISLDSNRDTITSIACMDMFNNSSSRNRDLDQLIVIVGHSSGKLAIYSKEGQLLMKQYLHTSEITRIQVYIPYIDPQKLANGICYSETEEHHRDEIFKQATSEIIISFSDGHLACIDAQSLWLSLQLCMKNIAVHSPQGDSELDSFFSYKKVHFGLPSFRDAVSLGPQEPTDMFSSLKTQKDAKKITARFLVAPPRSMLQVHMTEEQMQKSFSAVHLANRVASRVGGAVFNIAKSYFFSKNASHSPKAETTTQTRSTSFITQSETPVTKVPPVISLRDNARYINKIIPSPPQYHLSALADTLGRILIFDTEYYEIVSMYKGFRGGQCEWLEASNVLFIAMYASRLGLLQINSVVDPLNTLATFSVGKNCNLIHCFSYSLGDSLLIDNGATIHPVGVSRPASCYIVDASGFISQISITKNTNV